MLNQIRHLVQHIAKMNQILNTYFTLYQVRKYSEIVLRGYAKK
jgi:hypothetical protein